MKSATIKIGSVTFDRADHDVENDILYLHVGDPQEAQGEETPEGHVLRYAHEREIVGLTILGVQRILDRDGAVTITMPAPVVVRADALAPIFGDFSNPPLG